MWVVGIVGEVGAWLVKKAQEEEEKIRAARNKTIGLMVTAVISFLVFLILLTIDAGQKVCPII
jgi:hypothetical protein